MYWSDWNSPAKIEVANMDGTDRHIFVQGGGLTWPNGLCIDYNAGKLYWADARTDLIDWVYLNGFNRSVLLGRLNHPFGLDVHNGFIYWTDWTSKDIKRASISDPTSVVVMRSQLEGLMEIRVYDPERQNGRLRVMEGDTCTFRHLKALRKVGVNRSGTAFYQISTFIARLIIGDLLKDT